MSGVISNNWNKFRHKTHCLCPENFGFVSYCHLLVMPTNRVRDIYLQSKRCLLTE